jgi:hypothetical protein
VRVEQRAVRLDEVLESALVTAASRLQQVLLRGDEDG